MVVAGRALLGKGFARCICLQVVIAASETVNPAQAVNLQYTMHLESVLLNFA